MEAIQVMLQLQWAQILKGLPSVCERVKTKENPAITTLVSSAKESHVKALRNQINELKDNKCNEPSAVRGWLVSQSGRNAAAHGSGIQLSEGVVYFCP